MNERVLDVQGLNCPLPILKAQKALREIPAGAALRVLATDPLSMADFEAFCQLTGDELIELKQEGATFSFLIRRVA